jgi:3-dehydroquinate dehydratase-2
MASVLILNGPNLNMLGRREPEIYGTRTLADIEALCAEACAKRGWRLDFRQSNHEGELVTWIQEALDGPDGLILNAAAYTHTSLAIHDALKILTIPVIEVHLSNPAEREAFRHHSYIAPLARDVIAGAGPEGYVMALESLDKLLK